MRRPSISRRRSPGCCRASLGVSACPSFPSCRCVPAHEALLPARTEAQHAAAPLAYCPAAGEDLVEDGGAQATAEMAPPLAPIDAGAAKRPPDTLQGGDVDAQA